VFLTNIKRPELPFTPRLEANPDDESFVPKKNHPLVETYAFS